MKKKITEEELKKIREEYFQIRVKREITLRDMANALGVSPSDLSKIEYGYHEVKFIKTIEIDVICHDCGKWFKAHPIEGAVFASYICNECSLKRDFEEEAMEEDE